MLLGGLLSLDTAVLIYITGSAIFTTSLLQPLAIPAISAQFLPPAPPVGISVVTQPNAAICLFLPPQIALWHCSPLSRSLICAKSSCAVLLDRILRINKVSISCLPHIPSLAFGYFRKDLSLFTPKSCFAV